ncbi:LysR family transcriptional regulator [Acidimangrovimonas sediminis]|uniref:LysR family transcriptional regulator n=1 Tax=Acidimangrovimonas sediminis TaxID=2056283 RepID=UPI000C7FC656|nr:LysR family transcriptional regulator [Acidimangrovimonas sediminis]
MIGANLRHLRVFLAVAEGGSVTRAAALSYLSQPAVTQAIAKLEGQTGGPLFLRNPQGFFPTEAGEVLRRRAVRAFALLDPALTEIAPRLPRIASRPQLRALVAVTEAQNFTLAARALAISQPTVHRAIAQLEREAPQPLFRRSPLGVMPTRACTALARAARLAFAELDQADAELGELAGREVGRIAIGATPLARSHILPRALAAFRARRPRLEIRVLDGPYATLLAALRRGDIDFMVGALRDPAPIDDVVQERVFEDRLVILAGAGHPLMSGRPDVAQLAGYPWLVTRENTPARNQFNAMFDAAGVAPPTGVIETGSVILMREMVQDGRHLACVSRLQAIGEIGRGMVQALDMTVPGPSRPIGLTFREGWQPTPAQAQILDDVRAVEGE